ncbi:MAG: hypothetical protein ABSB73_06610, partial [Solirubrobacteraceae bacterium]
MTPVAADAIAGDTTNATTAPAATTVASRPRRPSVLRRMCVLEPMISPLVASRDLSDPPAKCPSIKVPERARTGLGKFTANPFVP